MFLTFAGMFIAFALAFVLACLDPIWKNKISLREGLAALIEKD
jgi:hypothetical protein